MHMTYIHGRCIKININTTIHITISIINYSNDKHIDNNNCNHWNKHNDKMSYINAMIIITIIIIIMIDNHNDKHSNNKTS